MESEDRLGSRIQVRGCRIDGFARQPEARNAAALCGNRSILKRPGHDCPGQTASYGDDPKPSGTKARHGARGTHDASYFLQFFDNLGLQAVISLPFVQILYKRCYASEEWGMIVD